MKIFPDSSPERSGQISWESCHGFTLMELLVVLSIIGLLTATVAVRWTGLTQKARLEWGIGRFIHLEAALRSHSQSHGGNAQLELEPGTGCLTTYYQGPRQNAVAQNLGEKVIIRRFISATQDVSLGKVRIPYWMGGRSPTYAVELNVPQATGKSTWLVFAGQTGNWTRGEEERDALRLIQVGRQTGADPR